MPKITIRTVCVNEVESFAEETLRTQPDLGGTVPISRFRARAWAHNPRSRPDDVALLAAFDGTRCVGHLGMYPDIVDFGTRRDRFFWLSIYYVQPDYRESGAGPMLLLRAIAINQHLGVTGVTPAAAKIYRALRFFEPPPVRFWRLSINHFDFAGVPLRLVRRLLSCFRYESRLLDRTIAFTQSAARFYTYGAIALIRRAAITRLRTLPLDRIRDDLLTIPRGSLQSPRLLRDAEFLNWNREYPWVSANIQERSAGNYFPDYLDSFRTEMVQLFDRDSERPIGTLVLRRTFDSRNTVLRVLAYGVPDIRDAPRVLTSVLASACRLRPDAIEIPDGFCKQLAPFSLLRMLFRPAEHRYFFYVRPGDVEAAEAVRSLRLRFLDGDVAFT
jgi:GNAT superfamily N-acetyltransferase